MKDPRFPGDDAVAVGVDRLSPFVGDACAAHDLEPRDHRLQALRSGAFGRIGDPAEQGSFSAPLAEQLVQAGERGRGKSGDQVPIRLSSRHGATGQRKSLDQARARDDALAQVGHACLEAGPVISRARGAIVMQVPLVHPCAEQGVTLQVDRLALIIGRHPHVTD